MNLASVYTGQFQGSYNNRSRQSYKFIQSQGMYLLPSNYAGKRGFFEEYIHDCMYSVYSLWSIFDNLYSMEHILLILTFTIVENRYIKAHNYIDTSSMAQFLLSLSCGIFVDILFVRFCELLFASVAPHPYHQLHLCDSFNTEISWVCLFKTVGHLRWACPSPLSVITYIHASVFPML